MRPATFALCLLLTAATLAAANWTSGGPYGGIFYSLDASASNPRVVYAAGLYGVFRSDDNGATWRNASNGLGATSQVVVDPIDPQTAYALGTGDFRFAYRTTNGGATWAGMSTGTRWTNTFLIDPANPQTLYVSADCGPYLEPLFEGSGIMKSTDGGRTWRRVMTGIGAPSFSACILGLSLDPANPSHLFAQAQYTGAAWESFDGAETWVLAKEAVPTGEVVIDPYQPSVRYGTNGRSVLRSDDGGVHWTAQPATGLPTGVEPTLGDLSLDPVTPRIFTATPVGLFRSGDGGRSWIPAGDVPRIRVHAVLFNAVDSTVMIATSQGLFRAPSPAFTPWTQLAVPESGMLIDQIAVDPKRPAVVYASSLDDSGEPRQSRIFRSSDGGATWLPIGDRFAWRPRMSVDASGDLWFANLSARTLQRIAEGASEVTPMAREFHDIQSVAAHPRVAGTVYVGSTNGETWRSGDAGATWSRCQYIPRVIQDIALDPNSDAVYVATLRGTFRSMNGCATFEQLDDVNSDSIVVAPSNPSVLYRVASGGVSRSDDGGTTWKPLSLPSGSGVAREVVVAPDDERRVWFAAAAVWQSNDGGESWRSVSAGLPRPGVTALAIDSSGGILHAGVSAAGVWELRVRPKQRSVRRR